MKKIIYHILIWTVVGLLNIGCNEDQILEEIPLDFLSPENSYETSEDFQLAINALYNSAREVLTSGLLRQTDFLLGTDLGFNALGSSSIRFGSYPATLTPSGDEPAWHWEKYYKIISSVNIILDQLENFQGSEGLRSQIEAESKIFRGLAYRNLAHLYGGVPITIEPITEPKTDFTRSSRDEVYLQAVSDLEFAAQNLPAIDEVEDGKVSNLAAYHILAEVYVSLDLWDDAIEAASVVINNPNTSLMIERFGSRKDDPGDVFWDLFRRDNQNRSSGNTEGIWIWQFEVDVPGGALITSNWREGCALERFISPRPWSFGYTDPGGVKPFLPSGVSDYTGGRGISLIRGTDHFIYGIWQSDWDDMRNSNYNMVRDVKFNNPASEWYGQWFSEHREVFEQTTNDTIRFFHPYPSKVTTPGNHPAELIVDAELMTLNSSTAGATYTDQYHIRLAETHLLRAEAYLGKGDQTNAANDINVIRSRANASLISPGEVDIDYILDERMRELNVEEKRRLTLNRLELLYDRTLRYCNGRPDHNFGCDVEPYHNLFPIPFGEIESNTDATIEQNPGYSAQ